VAERCLALLPAALCAAALAQAAKAPAVPEALKVAAGEHLVLVTHATGVQIYACSITPEHGAQWTLKGPDAVLHDAKGAVVGQHYAGPTWRHNDGSEVTGKASAHADAPDGHSIPWLLLTAVDHRGAGALAKVSSIQRLHTRGGAPPPADECSGPQGHAAVRVPYSADYYFYAPP
jgi:hypothetical protein